MQTQPTLQELKNAIAQEKLSADDLARRVMLVIDRELRKPESQVDLPLLRACEDLLYQLGAEQHYAVEIEAAKQRAQKRRLAQQNRRTAQRRVIAVVSAAAVLVASLLLGDALLRREGLYGESTGDEQQYFVTGKKQDPGLVQSGIADRKGSIDTSYEYGDLVAWLGFDPALPTWSPEGWIFAGYTAYETEHILSYSAYYTHPAENMKISFIASVFPSETSLTETVGALEGEKAEIADRQVYFSGVHEGAAGAWIEGNTACLIHGPVAQEDLIRMIESIAITETRVTPAPTEPPPNPDILYGHDLYYPTVVSPYLSQAAIVLGYLPPQPQWVPEEWMLHEYFAVSSDWSESFYATYTRDEDTYVLSYNIEIYDEPEYTAMYFEQNEQGYTVQCNGWEVYLAWNYDTAVAVWLEGNTTHSLYGPVTHADLLRMIESIDRTAE